MNVSRKLRCPRNFVHINLFVAFSFRTILTILVDNIINATYVSHVNDSLYGNQTQSPSALDLSEVKPLIWQSKLFK